MDIVSLYKSNKPIIIVVLVIVLAIVLASGTILFLRENRPIPDSFNGLPHQNSENQGASSLADPDLADRENSEINKAGVGDLTGEYVNSDFGFSFRYPAGFKVTEFMDEDAFSILVEKPGTTHGFQISITAFDEEGPIRAERILKDIPNLKIEEPQTVLIGRKSEIQNRKRQANFNNQIMNSKPEDGVAALVFFSYNSSVGRTREVWMVWPQSPQPHGNYLYQITSAAEFDAELSKIMATFQFK